MNRRTLCNKVKNLYDKVDGEVFIVLYVSGFPIQEGIVVVLDLSLELE